MTSEYIRVSAEYRIANGDVATRSTTDQAIHRARVGSARPSRSPAKYAIGRVATPMTADSARTAKSPSPNTTIQPWRSA